MLHSHGDARWLPQRQQSPFALPTVRLRSQVAFWKLRQSEQESYKLLYEPLRVRTGDLTDPLYFDFISHSQWAVINREMPRGKQVFEVRAAAWPACACVRVPAHVALASSPRAPPPLPLQEFCEDCGAASAPARQQPPGPQQAQRVVQLPAGADASATQQQGPPAPAAAPGAAEEGGRFRWQTRVVRRDTRLADNALLPQALCERVGDKVYKGLKDGFRVRGSWGGQAPLDTLPGAQPQLTFAVCVAVPPPPRGRCLARRSRCRPAPRRSRWWRACSACWT